MSRVAAAAGQLFDRAVSSCARRVRPAVDRIWVGTGLLLRRFVSGCAAWVRDGTSLLDIVVRLVALVVVAIIGWVIARGAPVLLWPASLVLLTAGYRAVPRTSPKRAAAAPAVTAPEAAAHAPADPVPDVSIEEFLDLVRAALGDGLGVRLSTLVEHLSRAYPGGWDIPAVKGLCRAAGVPVKQVRERGHLRASVGVHRDGLPALPSDRPTPPDVDVVVAGHIASTSPTTSPATSPATSTARMVGGYRVVAVDDPQNPARTHVKVTKEVTNR